MQDQSPKKRLANVGVGFRTKYTGTGEANKPVMKLWIRPEEFKALPVNAKGAVEISVFLAGPGKDGQEKNYHYDLAPAPQGKIAQATRITAQPSAAATTKGKSALPF